MLGAIREQRRFLQVDGLCSESKRGGQGQELWISVAVLLYVGCSTQHCEGPHPDPEHESFTSTPQLGLGNHVCGHHLVAPLTLDTE